MSGSIVAETVEHVRGCLVVVSETVEHVRGCLVVLFLRRLNMLSCICVDDHPAGARPVHHGLNSSVCETSMCNTCSMVDSVNTCA